MREGGKEGGEREGWKEKKKSRESGKEGEERAGQKKRGSYGYCYVIMTSDSQTSNILMNDVITHSCHQLTQQLTQQF